jgi:hypothetical protein
MSQVSNKQEIFLDATTLYKGTMGMRYKAVDVGSQSHCQNHGDSLAKK